MLWQRSGQAQQCSALDRISDCDIFLLAQIIIKATDAAQMAVYRLGLQPFAEQIVNISVYLAVSDLLNGHIEPQHKVSQGVQIVLNCMGRVVAALQMAAVIDD